MSKKLKLSPWHDGSVKPVHVGIYQKKNPDGVVWFSFWNGKRFSEGCGSIGMALRYKDQNSIFQDGIKWRGVLK